jgi:hypothetical protein
MRDTGHLIADPAGVVRLEEVVSEQIRLALDLMAPERFPVDQQDVSEEALRRRLDDYWTATEPLLNIALHLGRWGRKEHVPIIERLLGHLLVPTDRSGGYLIWIGLQWYPLTLVYYALGVAAFASRNWVILGGLYNPDEAALPGRSERRSLADQVVAGLVQYSEVNTAFKALPVMSQKRFPVSETLFQVLTEPVADGLFLDAVSYEHAFDRFEVFRALQYAVGPLGDEPRLWGPVGRFGWKSDRGEGDPMTAFETFLRNAPDDHPILGMGSFVRGREEVLRVLTAFRMKVVQSPW